MTRLTALLYLAIGILLSSCSSEPDVLYQDINGLVVIEAETWSSKKDSSTRTWIESSSWDIDTIAKLGTLQPDAESINSAKNRNPTAVYDIYFEATGPYYLWVRARLTTASASAVLNLSLEPSSGSDAIQIAEFSDQWQWIALGINQNALSVTVANSGRQSLRMTANTSALLVDKIILTAQPDYLPAGNGPAATLIVTDAPLTESGDDSEHTAVEAAAGGSEENTDEGATPDERNHSVTENSEHGIANPGGAVNDPSTTDSAAVVHDQTGGANAQPQVTISVGGTPTTHTTIILTEQLQLVADATDDGLPTAALYTYWTKVTGPDDVAFSDQTARDPIVRFDTVGTYTLQVSANDTELYKNAMITIDVTASTTAATESNTSSDTDSTNDQNSTTTQPQADPVADRQPPAVSISGAATVATGVALELTATTTAVSDSPVYYYWNAAHSGNVITFDDHQQQTTNVSFDQPGQYLIQVTVSDDISYINATHEITVTSSLNAEAVVTNDQSVVDSQTDNHTEQSQANLTNSNVGAAHRWHQASSQGAAAKRHETSGVAVNGKMYVIGGRGHQPIDVYDTASNTWSQAARPPLEMHHFQAVAIDHIIYVVGAATCCYPVEINIPNVYQFDTNSGQWSKGAAIPGNRLRGSTAAAVYNKKIYIVGGNTKGHSGGAVNWFDEFDPATGQWKALGNAPDARDHATIAVVGDQLVVAGGRRSNFPDTFGNTVGRTNVYDLKQQRWQTAANIPTQRAGTMAVGVGSELIVIGGESLASNNAHNAVEAFDIFTGTWRRLNPLPTPRHGGAAAVIDSQIHVVAGSMQLGGAPETNAHEILK